MLKIYLADLIYDTIKTNYSVPLNIAYLAAYLEKRFSNQIKITLFKFPSVLEATLRDNPPDILGLSHYSWNSRLNMVFLNMFKRLNHRGVTVMGGPNIRTNPEDLKQFLIKYPDLDYYITYDGEKPFGELVNELLSGVVKPKPIGCATLIEKELFFKPVDYNKENTIIDLPSPYLSGWLDDFIKNQNMFPLFETNRGCPFGCVYCCWGVESRARMRLRPLEMVYEEIEYVAEKSVGQLYWYFCDGNFGIFPRDVDISKKIREVMDKKGYPSKVEIFHSKNTSVRNIEIAENLGSKSKGYMAIQSADPEVLAYSGRGKINVEEITKQISYYKDKNLEVATDVLIGLPSETAQSHLNTLVAAFDMGFDTIDSINIRLLPGSKYESEEYRKKYSVMTKYRPIFGAYGIYDDHLTFEIEESIRATKDMSEKELNDFKVIHWLIYFAWNAGIFKPILKFGKKHGINPALVLNELAHTNEPILKQIFDQMREESMKEWFSTAEAMVVFYSQRKNFDEMVNNFIKLNYLYIAVIYQKPEVIFALQQELVRIVRMGLPKGNEQINKIMEEIVQLSDQLLCKDLLQESTSKIRHYSSETVSTVISMPEKTEIEQVEVEIYRPEEFVSFCRFYLGNNGEKDLSLSDLAKFLEARGIEMLRNKLRIVEK